MRYLPSGKIIVDDLDELREIVKAKEIPLDLIDIKASGLTSLDNLFDDINEINGAISDWDVSDIKSLISTFEKSTFNPDLSKWNIYNCINFSWTFYKSNFNGDISQWNFNNDLNQLSTYKILSQSQNFMDKYNNEKNIPNDSDKFLYWFEKNKNKIYEIHHNINKETKLELDDYLSTFELQGIVK